MAKALVNVVQSGDILSGRCKLLHIVPAVQHVRVSIEVGMRVKANERMKPARML